MAHVEGVEIGELVVAREDYADRGRARCARGFESDPHGSAQAMARDHVRDTGSESDVDPERRQVDRRGGASLGVVRLDRRAEDLLAFKGPLGSGPIGFLGSGIHRALDSSHRSIPKAHAPASRCPVLTAPPRLSQTTLAATL